MAPMVPRWFGGLANSFSGFFKSSSRKTSDSSSSEAGLTRRSSKSQTPERRHAVGDESCSTEKGKKRAHDGDAWKNTLPSSKRVKFEGTSNRASARLVQRHSSSASSSKGDEQPTTPADKAKQTVTRLNGYAVPKEQNTPISTPTKSKVVESSEVGGDDVITRGRVAHKGDPDFADRSDLEIKLFNLMNGRGLDPIFASDWKLDLPTYPNAMFVAPADEATSPPLIRALHDTTFHSLKQFQTLSDIGGRVHDRKLRNLSSPHLLQRCFNKYIEWMMADARLAKRGLLPTLIVKANKALEDQDSLIRRVKLDLSLLATRHREESVAADMILAATPVNVKVERAQRVEDGESGEGSGKAERSGKGSGEGAISTSTPSPGGNPSNTAQMTFPNPPILFSLMIYHSSVIVVALDAANDTAQPVARASFEFGQPGMHAWHAIGIALLVALVRDDMLQRHGQGQSMSDNEEEDDPDK